MPHISARGQYLNTWAVFVGHVTCMAFDNPCKNQVYIPVVVGFSDLIVLLRLVHYTIIHWIHFQLCAGLFSIFSIYRHLIWMGPGSRGCTFARTLVQSMVTVATEHLTFHQFAVIIQRLRALFRPVIKASRQLQQPPKRKKVEQGWTS